MKTSMIIKFFVCFFILILNIADLMAWQGPSGGTGGDSFNSYWDGPYIYPSYPYNRKISAIIVRAGSLIDAIQLQYADRNGNTYLSPKWGGNGGKENRVYLAKNQYLTGITGTHNGRYITWLCFYFRNRDPISFGGGTGYYDFSYWAPEGTAIMDILGRAGSHLDAIGVRYMNLITEFQDGIIYDCDGIPVDENKAFNWRGDGYCDDGSSGINMDCWIFHFDEGDCR